MNDINNINVINIQNLVIEGHGSYKNGDFVPCFKDSLFSLVKIKDLQGAFWRVFIFLLTKLDKNNQISVSQKEIRAELDLSRTTVHDTIARMVDMRIICAVDTNASPSITYKFNDEIIRAINPRIAFIGNTRKINKNLAPRIVFNGADIQTGIPQDEIPFEQPPQTITQK